MAMYLFKKGIIWAIGKVELHFHQKEKWFGLAADQSGDNWADGDTMDPYRANSGPDSYGTDLGDTAKVLGSDDTPIFAGSKYFNIRRLFVTATRRTAPYKIRIVWGSGTMIQAIVAGQFTEIYSHRQSRGNAMELMMPRIRVGTQVWVQVRASGNNSWFDFYVGVHEYLK